MNRILSLSSVADAREVLDGLKPCESPYAETLVDALDEIGRRIRHTGTSDPALVSAAYWLRRANLIPYLEHARKRSQIVRPRGMVFHVAPGNVETMFLYSWSAGFLSGNANLVRLGSTHGELTEIIVEAAEDVLSEAGLDATTRFVSYRSTNSEITRVFSESADVRMIWGGNETISRIRAQESRVTCKDLLFADKRSAAIIDAEAYLQASSEERDDLARRFVVDAWTFWQMACSSPHRLVWKGDEQGLDDFLARVEAEADARVDDEPMIAMNRFVEASTAAMDGAKVGLFRRLVTVRGYSTSSHPGGGVFEIEVIRRFDVLHTLFDDRSQTLAYWGIDVKGLAEFGPNVDRIVPIGKALEFSLFWDGYDLLGELVRFQELVGR